MILSETLDRRSWQERAVTQILAVIVVYVPLYVFALWSPCWQSGSVLSSGWRR